MGWGQHRLKLLMSAAAVLMAAPAHAQQTPPANPPSSQPPAQTAAPDAAHDTDEIVIIAPGDQSRIDRHVYTLRDDPAAQATNMFDVLGRVPSVSVAPSGAITLLGASNVTVQINGQPAPSNNLEQVLRGITGADVERIEVITNPSAQYSAQASGGIINIVTRQRFNAGFSGNTQIGVDTMHSYNVGFSPSWSEGPWSFSGGGGIFGGTQEQDFERERTTFSSGVTTLETGVQAIDFNGWYLSRLQVGYRPNERRRMSIALDGVSANNDLSRPSMTRANAALLSSQATQTAVQFQNQQLTFDFQQTGARPREQLKLNAVLTHFSVDFDQRSSFTPNPGALSAFRALSSQDTRSATAKLDYERPMAGENFMTLGASFDQQNQTIDTARQTLSGPALPPDFAAALDGRQQTLAGYATYQLDTGDWTWLPGVRGENYRREVVSSGLETDRAELNWFPSLHMRRALTPQINLDASYSRRVQRPGFQQLDPALRFTDVNRASSGNPNLEPTFTDAYEANLTYQKAGQTINLTFYDRISDDIVSPFTQVLGSGVILTTQVNAGTSEQRGLQALLRGPLSAHWRYSLTANVLNREFDALSAGVTSRRNEIEYDGAAQLDYRDANQDRDGANQFQIELRFQGPRHTLQSDSDEFIVANFTWRRRLTPKLFGVLIAQDIFSTQNNINEVTTDLYTERTAFNSTGARVRFALTYQFGSAPQQPPRDQPAPMGPIPGQ